MVKEIFNKLFCCHDWELKTTDEIYYDYKANKKVYVYICNKCGKIKKVKI